MNRNLTMLFDIYEISMANGFMKNGLSDTVAYYDMYYRNVPDNGGFVVMAGVDELVDYLSNINFTDDDIAYLRTQGIDEQFLDYLKNFHFDCDVWAVPEGTPIFKNEPIVTVRGPVIQAQLIETMLLMLINHQSLIATKANRIVRAASGRSVVEFGARRAQGSAAAVFGARSAYIGGCVGTTNLMAGETYGIPLFTSMTPSWVQLFDSELDAFRAYARMYPDNCTLLIDTYNVIKSGLPNAIEAFRTEILPHGSRPKAVRINSGDITYLSKIARKKLDEAGFPDCKIIASNSLDEYIIRDMLLQGAKVDIFGVGERLVTSSSSPVLDGVYKLSAIEKDGKVIPKIRLSENVEKINTPGAKKLYRLFGRDDGKAIADVVTLADESIDESVPFTLFDPDYTWKKKEITDFVARPLLRQIFDHGNCVYEPKTISETRAYCLEQIGTLWEEVIRFEHPHKYYVDLSQKLWDMKNELIGAMR
jgi:nicotinate phosphoribosyltransferase